jgi:hypothetical protein
MGDKTGSTVAAVATPPNSSSDIMQSQQTTQQQQQQQWMFNNYGLYNMYPQYAQYYSAYYNHFAQMQQQQYGDQQKTSEPASSNAPPGFGNAVVLKKTDDPVQKTGKFDINPPLPPGPPPPPPTQAYNQSATSESLLARPAFFNESQNNTLPNQFNPIRFNINNSGKRNLQTNTPTFNNPIAGGCNEPSSKKKT